MKKRILSILLTLCMVLSMVTPLASATETGQPEGNTPQPREPLSLEEGETYWFQIGGMINGQLRFGREGRFLRCRVGCNGQRCAVRLLL